MNQEGSEACGRRKKRFLSYRLQIIHSKGAILVIIWTALAWPNDIFNVEDLNPNNVVYLAFLFWNTFYLCGLFYPFAGWIADSWTGRYKFLIASLYISFIATIVSGCGSVLGYCQRYSYITDKNVIIVAEVFAYVGFIFRLVGHSGFAANAIPYLIDQMIGARADQLSAAIHWDYWGIHLGNIFIFVLNTVKFSDVAFAATILPLIQALCLTVVILTNHSCHTYLNKKPLLQHPIRQICEVLNYARKHKFPERRSAFTYWEEDYPSRIDLGKGKYGGPFDVEKVEDVKSFLRLVLLIFIAAGVGLQTEPNTMTYHFHQPTQTSFVSDLIYKRHILGSSVVFILIPLYAFVVSPFLYKIVPTLLVRMGIGLLFSLISVVLYTLMDNIGHMKSGEVPCYYQPGTSVPNSNLTLVLSIDYHWLVLPELFHQLAFLFVIVSALEFIVAQSPNQMRGLMVGVWYASFTMWQIIGYNLVIPFDTIFPHNCLSYYFCTKSVVIGILLLLFMMYSIRYKLRMRDEVMNYNWIAEQHVENWLKEERQYSNAALY